MTERKTGWFFKIDLVAEIIKPKQSISEAKTSSTVVHVGSQAIVR